MNECYTIQYDTIPVVVVVEAKKRNGRERERERRVKKVANEELAEVSLLNRIPILCTKSQQRNAQGNKQMIVKQEIER